MVKNRKKSLLLWIKITEWEQTEGMKERSSSVLNDSELRFSGEQGFFDKSSSIRLLIGLAFALSMFLFFHFREVRVEILELNSRAPKYVVAQVDFEFVDREATLILKQEAVRNVGKIYKIPENQITQRRLDFENLLVRDEAFRKRLPDISFDEVSEVLDSLQKAMNQLRFTDPRTLRKIREANYPSENYQIFTPLNLEAETDLPKQIWSKLARDNLSQEKMSAIVVDAVIEYFDEKPWKIDEDIPAQKQLRTNIQNQVPDKLTRVTSGSRIIDFGEKVTPRHLAMMQAMKIVIGERRNLWHIETLFGSILLTLLVTGICAAFIKVNYPMLFQSNRKLCLIVTVVILNFAFAKGLEYFLLTSPSNLLDLIRYPLFVPFAAILTCNLISASLATFVTALLIVIFTMTLSFDYTGFMIINLVASLVAILSTQSLRRRKEIFVVCFKAWLGAVVVIIAIHMYANSLWGWIIVYDLISSALFMLLTVMLVLGLLPLLESAFHVMSDMTLMEYMDPNHELLKRLSFEAPGTYQHTLMVCNITEVAAVSIGANGLFCRVASLYHDIGKMVTPHFFTENQQGEMNVHQLLTPLESAQTIMAHVSEGVAMARKSGLPEQFIDIIKEHHGTQLVYFFYRKALDQAKGDESLVDQSQFRYAGPKPRTKESAIIMIADSFEAASRSLDEIDEKSLSKLVDEIVREKAEDGQLDECLLTFEELSVVKKTMVQTLVAGLHTRVKYPKRKVYP
ncbi:MAG: Cyclic-di-AMP phosphodiesterase PgpH [Chlamydiae bacterium]|nr:Cyclic-di-AMP phosphodiesterase PgpH [Chlamydiota bacterium]